MPRKTYQDKWDAEHMASQTIRVKRELLDSFKAACAARGDAVNAVFRVAMEDYTAGRYQPETRCKPAADAGSAQDQTGSDQETGDQKEGC